MTKEAALCAQPAHPAGRSVSYPVMGSAGSGVRNVRVAVGGGAQPRASAFRDALPKSAETLRRGRSLGRGSSPLPFRDALRVVVEGYANARVASGKRGFLATAHR